MQRANPVMVHKGGKYLIGRYGVDHCLGETGFIKRFSQQGAYDLCEGAIVVDLGRTGTVEQGYAWNVIRQGYMHGQCVAGNNKAAAGNIIQVIRYGAALLQLLTGIALLL